MAHPTKIRTKRATALFDRVRKLCLAHPGVYEKEAWGEATFRVERGKMFLMTADDHHGDGRVAAWCLATADAREALLDLDAERFFIPPYVGASGWVGVSLEGRMPWSILADVISEGVRLAAPRSTPKRKRSM